MEIIIAAAIQKSPNEIWVGKNHSECFVGARNAKKHFGYLKGCPQGFITSTGRFVSRIQAAKIAFEAGQTTKCYEELDSEDLEL